MQRHRDQLCRLVCIPAFVEEALGNASLKAVIAAFIVGNQTSLMLAVDTAVYDYAEQWVDEWMERHPQPLYDRRNRDVSPELRAIAAGEDLFYRPVTTSGLPTNEELCQ